MDRIGWSRRIGLYFGMETGTQEWRGGRRQMRAALYARVSTERQGREQTIASQLSLLNE